MKKIFILLIMSCFFITGCTSDDDGLEQKVFENMTVSSDTTTTEVETTKAEQTYTTETKISNTNKVYDQTNTTPKTTALSSKATTKSCDVSFNSKCYSVGDSVNVSLVIKTSATDVVRVNPIYFSVYQKDISAEDAYNNIDIVGSKVVKDLEITKSGEEDTPTLKGYNGITYYYQLADNNYLNQGSSCTNCNSKNYSKGQTIMNFKVTFKAKGTYKYAFNSDIKVTDLNEKDVKFTKSVNIK